MTILLKAIYRFNAIYIKLPMVFITELVQKISQFIQEHKRPLIGKVILHSKNGAGESVFLISNYTAKLHSSRQYATGRKTEI